MQTVLHTTETESLRSAREPHEGKEIRNSSIWLMWKFMKMSELALNKRILNSINAIILL